MNRKVFPGLAAMVSIKGIGCVVALLASITLRADQVEMENGDHYAGKVLSLNDDRVVLETDVLGTLRLPRSKVVSISLNPAISRRSNGSNAPVNASASVRPQAPPSSHPPGVASNSWVTAALRQLPTNTIRQVQGQFLAGSGPEANNKFNELLGGLINGQVTVSDIRVQAKSAAEQIRSLKRDLGSDAGWALDGYLAILEHFLSESEPPATAQAGASRTSSPAPPKTNE